MCFQWQEKQRSTITVINETWDRSTARMKRLESAGMAVQTNSNCGAHTQRV